MPFWKLHPHAESREAELWVVVGLGNPGSRYERTRHNAGFIVANELARRASVSFRSSKHRAEVARARLDGHSLILALPVTYMNDSGIAVSRLLGYYHVPADRLIVICDDMDLPFGTLRLRPSGSAGGNNGLKSVIRELGTEDFARLRVGVGRPQGEAINYVLGEFPPEQRRLLPGLVSIAADAVLASVEGGAKSAMNDYNRNWLPELEQQASSA